MKWPENYVSSHPDASGFLWRVASLLLHPIYRKPRLWSNVVLRKIAPYFHGRILNCSGWADEDKFGGHYSTYFSGATEYSVSNWEGGPQKGMYSNLPDSIQLDLEKPLADNLLLRFDCVFSHTVLEHVFEIQAAVKNLADMTTDAVIVCIPWTQLIHVMEGKFGDYWRFTPDALAKLFSAHGLTEVFRSGTDIPGGSVYYLCVFSRHPERYHFAPWGELPSGDDMYQSVRWRNCIKWLLGRPKHPEAVTGLLPQPSMND